jgi:hypothetical protein
MARASGDVLPGAHAVFRYLIRFCKKPGGIPSSTAKLAENRENFRFHAIPIHFAVLMKRL